jgi:hypothetical protein
LRLAVGAKLLTIEIFAANLLRIPLAGRSIKNTSSIERIKAVMGATQQPWASAPSEGTTNTAGRVRGADAEAPLFQVAPSRANIIASDPVTRRDRGDHL